MDYESDPQRASCKSCLLHFDLKNELAPCLKTGECKFGKPFLLYSNKLAYEIFTKIQNQMIVVGMGEPIGINQQAIVNILDIYGITDLEERRILFEKVLAIDTFRMTKMLKEKEKEKKKKRKEKEKEEN